MSVRQTLARLDDNPDGPPLPPVVVALHVTMIDLVHNGNSFEEALVAAERASELAHVLGDNRLLAQSELRRGLALHGVDRLDGAQRVLDKTAVLAGTVGDRAGAARALIWTGQTLLLRGKPRQARDYYDRALRVDESRGDVAETAYGISSRGAPMQRLRAWSHS